MHRLEEEKESEFLFTHVAQTVNIPYYGCKNG